MDSFKDVLEAAQAYCKTQMAEPTYNLYIDGLEPISFEDSSHITLSVRNDFICKIVTDRYLGLLKEAFKTVLGFDVDITLVVPSTPPHEVVLAQQYEANPASPQGNYEFTFENFIKGPSNQFAFAAAQAVAANPSGPITRCSSTAAPVWARPICSRPSRPRSSAPTPILLSCTLPASSSPTS